VSSRKDLAISPVLKRVFISYAGISDLRLLLSINGCESFLKIQGVVDTLNQILYDKTIDWQEIATFDQGNI